MGNNLNFAIQKIILEVLYKEWEYLHKKYGYKKILPKGDVWIAKKRC